MNKNLKIFYGHAQNDASLHYVALISVAMALKVLLSEGYILTEYPVKDKAISISYSWLRNHDNYSWHQKSDNQNAFLLPWTQVFDPMLVS